MDNTNWYKQSPERPLFDDVLWSKPEHRSKAGKLLIVGGNAYSFAAPAKAFQEALKAGVGSAKVVLPDATRKVLGRTFHEADFVPSTPSGSFAHVALAELLDNAAWANGVLLAGDFGHNSETAILLESFIKKYDGISCITQDGLEYFLTEPKLLTERASTLIATNFGQLQKIVTKVQPNLVLKHSMNLSELVGILSDWSSTIAAGILSEHQGYFIVAVGGKVSTTPAKNTSSWQVPLAARATVWYLQQPAKPFETITTAIFEYLKNS
jgi:NAD(P)H-hydrate repair Nnr-like enzyme with NAD(P)H-hydrate dehydratase domain